MDLSIGEFQEVGNIVKQFASDDATVVVGTVIDPEMSNQVRVTVVATGLGRAGGPARVPASAAAGARSALSRERDARGAAGHARWCAGPPLAPSSDYAGARQADRAAAAGGR